jgi:hypothetical protein
MNRIDLGLKFIKELNLQRRLQKDIKSLHAVLLTRGYTAFEDAYAPVVDDITNEIKCSGQKWETDENELNHVNEVALAAFNILFYRYDASVNP